MIKQADYDLVILGHFAKDKLVYGDVEQDALGGAIYYGGLGISHFNIRTAVITRLAKKVHFNWNKFRIFQPKFFILVQLWPGKHLWN